MSRPVSVIVLNYNGARWLRGCLDALAAQVDAPDFEVMVVDNASSDDSVAIVRREYPGVRLVETGSNLGFAAGNNVGARQATGRYLVFLNNDTSAEPAWLGRLCRVLDERPDVGLATSRLVRMDDPQRIDSAGDGYFRAGGAFKRGHGGRADRYATSGEVFGACGAALAIRRELFERLGGFDESFFMVYEDVDLSYRARLAGSRCWYVADAVVRHAGSATLGRVSANAVFHGQRNLEWTWVKNTPAPLLRRTVMSHVVYSLAGLLHYARVGRLGAALRGKLAAAAGLPAVLRARRHVQTNQVDAHRIEAMMEGSWIRIKTAEKRVG